MARKPSGCQAQHKPNHGPLEGGYVMPSLHNHIQHVKYRGHCLCPSPRSEPSLHPADARQRPAISTQDAWLHMLRLSLQTSNLTLLFATQSSATCLICHLTQPCSHPVPQKPMICSQTGHIQNHAKPVDIRAPDDEAEERKT